MTRYLLLLLCSLSLCLPVVAQPAISLPGYSVSPGDTLSYRYESEGEVFIEDTKISTIAESSENHWVFISNDNVLGYVSRISFSGDSMSEPFNLDTSIEEPFHLKIDDTGALVKTSGPELSPELAALWDGVSVEGLLPRLPDEELLPGFKWSDIRSVNAMDMVIDYTTQFEVVGDTVVLGRPAWTVSAVTQMEMTSDSDGMALNLKGPDQAHYFFSKDQTVLLTGSGQSEMEGTMLTPGEDGETMELPMRMTGKWTSHSMSGDSAGK